MNPLVHMRAGASRHRATSAEAPPASSPFPDGSRRAQHRFRSAAILAPRGGRLGGLRYFPAALPRLAAPGNHRKNRLRILGDFL
jgi:hypothetical protein